MVCYRQLPPYLLRTWRLTPLKTRKKAHSFFLLLSFVFTQFSGWSVFLNGNWNTANFVTSYMPLVVFPILYFAAKFWTRVPVVKVEDMDFNTGIAEIEANTYDEPPPRNRMEAFWQWLVSDRVEAFRMHPLICLSNRCEQREGVRVERYLSLRAFHNIIQFSWEKSQNLIG